MLKIYEDSKNYTGTIVKLASTFPLDGLDNLVGTSVFGNTCIIPKSYNLTDHYVFFPSETQLAQSYLSKNNLYRNSNLNEDQKSKGYFEDNGRIKAIKFKGNKSTGIVMPISSLLNTVGVTKNRYEQGVEFNEIDGTMICKKFVVVVKGSNNTPKVNKVLDEIIDSRMFPEHLDSAHLLKYLDNLNLNDHISITIKVHGTSARVAKTLIKRKLKWHEKIAKKLGVQVVEEEYNYVVGSRRVIKSVGFSELKNKNHFYEEDLWTKVARENFEGKLHDGEAVYFEIYGKDYTGAEIQKGYSYNCSTPQIHVYRISRINPKGIETDLSWKQVKMRCIELGVNPVITDYEGKLSSLLLNVVKCTIDDFIPEKISIDGSTPPSEPTWKAKFQKYMQDKYLDHASWLDNSVIEEGVCLRVENYPIPKVYKLKSPLFLIHETKQADAEVVDVESNN